MTSAAAATPATRPATIDRRGRHRRAEGTSTSGPGRSSGTRATHAAPMADLAERIRTRLLPAVLTPLGVTLLAAGSCRTRRRSTAGPGAIATPDPTAAVAADRRRRSSPCRRSARPRRRRSRRPTPPADRVATRVRDRRRSTSTCRSSSRRPTDAYPLCDVAMYIERRSASRATGGRPTCTPTRATGMFLPLLERRTAERQAARHGRRGLDERRPALPVRDHRGPAAPARPRRRRRRPHEQLWLQTSEGPKGTPGKTQVVAKPISVEAAPTTPPPTPSRSRWSAAELRSSRSCAGRPRRPRPRDVVAVTIQNPLASPPAERRARLAHPEDPGHGADAGQDAR